MGVISPFNFPLVLAIRSVAPALALGNAVVLKPDPRTAVCGGVALARVFEDAARRGWIRCAAMGGLGFGLPAAIGVRMASPTRPVVAVLGDGSSLYGIQALWSAAHYRIGALIVVLANGRYAVMDRLAERHAGGEAKVPWPAFPEVSLSAMARSFGCPALRIDTHDRLVAVLDEIVPTLASRTEPLLLDIGVAPDAEFHP